METFLIGYDLNKPRKEGDYPNIISEIKTLFPNWWHHLDSTWIVKSDLTTVEIRDKLKSCLDDGDELLVVKLAGIGAWIGFNTNGSQWLKNNL